MSYGDFNTQIKARGATAILRVADEKLTRFMFEDLGWTCSDKNRPQMTNELSDGYEMGYCLALYCEPRV